MKKLISLLLVLVMAFTLAVPAFAEDGSLRIIGGASTGTAEPFPANVNITSEFKYIATPYLYQYYEFEVADNSIVSLSISNPDYYVMVYLSDSKTPVIKKFGGFSETKFKVGGAYTLVIEAPSEKAGDFSFKLAVRDCVPAKGVEVKMKPSVIPYNYKGKVKVTVTTIPANSDDKLERIDSDKYKYSDDGNSCEYTIDFDGKGVSKNMIGNKAWVRFKTISGVAGTGRLKVKPETPILRNQAVKTTYNSIKVLTAGGPIDGKAESYQLQYRVSGSKKWITAGTSALNKTLTIKKLKAATKYDLRMRGVEDGVYSEWSKVLTVKTGVKVKPVINSIKFSNIKTTKVVSDKKAASYTTSATVKVTLKKEIKGISGLVLECGNNKGTCYLTSKDGKTFSGKVSWNGKQKNKAMEAYCYTYLNKTYIGRGPNSATKKVTLK